ncbi:uncharacterized protein LOC129909175 [Episyrphus balteatus]|uniref:uncharacterized protein LOC129909175 n=1 Tax=Episyrphus balteatus TaxID=286459 RepID=UPI002485401E|nr:uncharacterized protein LOC129909175 [Episyrphus balteatus]
MPRVKASDGTKQKYKIIASVRAHKSLYDPIHLSYENLKSRDRIWSQVAEECGIKNGALARATWQKLYDTYVAYRKNPKHNLRRTHTWFLRKMNFLDPYLNIRKDDEKSHNNTENGIKPTTIEAGIIQNLDEINTASLNDTTSTREFSTIQYWSDSQDNLPQNVTELETNGTLPTKIETDVETNTGSDVESYEDIILPEAIDPKNEKVDSNTNSLKMFFDAMYASTSQLPQALQRTVKMKLFSAILEAEEEAENQKKNALAANCIQILE